MITSVTALLANTFGGRLLKGRPIAGRYQALETDTHHPGDLSAQPLDP